MDEQEDAVSSWQLRDVRLAAVSGVFLAVGLAVTAFGAGGAAAVAFVGGLVAGGAPFAPSSLRRLVHRQLGVGTLMTIAAIGAVALRSAEHTHELQSLMRTSLPDFCL